MENQRTLDACLMKADTKLEFKVSTVIILFLFVVDRNKNIIDSESINPKAQLHCLTG